MRIMKIDLASIFFDRNCPLRTPLEIAFQSIRRPFVACALAARVSRSWKVEPSVKLCDLRDKVKRMRICMKNKVLVSERLRPSEHTDCNSTDVQRLLSLI